jgi:hypothetical protein
MDTFAHEQHSIQRADELGVLDEWVEQRYGKYAVWPARCDLTAIPSERQFMALPQQKTLCPCPNCQRWAFRTLSTLSDRVVTPLIDGDKQQGLDALKEILADTRNAGRDLRANTVYPDWRRQIRVLGSQPFRCDATSEHPESAVTADNVGDNPKLCPCGPCQRWAARSLLGSVALTSMARFGDKDMALRQLKSSARMSTTERDYEGARMQEMEKARELGVLDEWVEHRHGRRAVWLDRCAVTGLYSDMALRSCPTSFCECDSCRAWAFGALRQMHVEVFGPLVAGEEKKALEALMEIAGDPPVRLLPAPPLPQPVPQPVL